MNGKDDMWEYFTMLTESDKKWMPADAKARLQKWQNRFKFYTDIDTQEKWLKKLKRWKKKNSLIRHAKKLKSALLALEELDNKYNLVTDPIDQKKFHKMKTAALSTINMQLLKFEITQMRMLEKAQNITREFDGIKRDALEKELKNAREKFHAELKNRKTPYSEKAKIYKMSTVITFFHEHEKKTPFSKYFKKSDQAADTISVFGSINSFLTRIGKAASESLIDALAGALTFLQAIPFLNAFISGIPIAFLAAKAWLRNKSRTKKTISLILIGVLIGGMITTGFGTLAAALVAVALMSVGIYVKHIHPWLKMQHEKRKKQKELIALAETHEQLNNNELFTLGLREQQFLIVQVEKAWLTNKLTLTEQVNLMSLIKVGNFKILNEETLIKHILPENKLDLKSFLLSRMDQHKQDLSKDIEHLSQNEKAKRWFVGNGLLSIVGAILVCIPTPITMIIGACFLLTSAIIGVTFAYDLQTKFMNLITRKKPNKNDETNIDSTQQHTPKEILEIQARYESTNTSEPTLAPPSAATKNPDSDKHTHIEPSLEKEKEEESEGEKNKM